MFGKRRPTTRFHLFLVDAPEHQFLFEHRPTHIRRVMQFSRAIIVQDLCKCTWVAIVEKLSFSRARWRDIFSYPVKPCVWYILESRNMCFMSKSAYVYLYCRLVAWFNLWCCFKLHFEAPLNSNIACCALANGLKDLNKSSAVTHFNPFVVLCFVALILLAFDARRLAPRLTPFPQSDTLWSLHVITLWDMR